MTEAAVGASAAGGAMRNPAAQLVLTSLLLLEVSLVDTFVPSQAGGAL